MSESTEERIPVNNKAHIDNFPLGRCSDFETSVSRLGNVCQVQPI
jgi:hypothetical protein